MVFSCRRKEDGTTAKQRKKRSEWDERKGKAKTDMLV